MEKINENFKPVYNNVDQVRRCAFFMLGEEVKEAHIAIVIGHNGKNFVSSTDWRLTTQNGYERILPFNIQAQYPNFVEAIAGVQYEVTDNGFQILQDAPLFRKSAKVILGPKEYSFKPGEALKIYVQPNSKFIATDCRVTLEEQDTVRIFTIHMDCSTSFGFLNEEGCVSYG